MKAAPKPNNTDFCIIVPVYNEEKVIRQVIQDLEPLKAMVVAVDDGSTDGSVAQIRQTTAVLVKHSINLGQGAAIQTGLAYALKNPALRYFATFDGDGQHSPQDLTTMLSQLKTKQFDIVLGSRFLAPDQPKIPRLKKYLLRLAVIYSNATTKTKLSDAHNGLRVFNRSVAEALELKYAGMAHASEIIHKIAAGQFTYTEVPVTIAYNNYTKTKGQPMINSINIVFDLVLERLLGP